jgi:hypothetical protein
MSTIRQGSGAGVLEVGEIFAGHHANSNDPANENRIAANAGSLPPPRPERWVPRRKAEIVDAVRRGFLSLGEACERYALSMEEYLAWQRDVELFGLSGLRVSRPRRRRPPVSRPMDEVPQYGGAHGPAENG